MRCDPVAGWSRALFSLGMCPHNGKPGVLVVGPHTLICRMHDASRYIDYLLTMNFPEFEEVMYRARGEVDPQGTTGGPLTRIYPNTFSNGGTEEQGLVLERVQPESTSAERIVGEVDYLDFTI